MKLSKKLLVVAASLLLGATTFMTAVSCDNADSKKTETPATEKTTTQPTETPTAAPTTETPTEAPTTETPTEQPTTEEKVVTTVTVPTVGTTALAYTGSEVTLVVPANDAYNVYANKATAAGNYEAVVVLKDKDATVWSDGSTEDKKIAWSVSANTVTAPSATTVAFAYTGSEINLGLTASEKYVISGDKATTVGTHTATITLKDPANNKWEDGTTADKTISWTISAAVATAPSATTVAFTYTGSEISLGLAADAKYTITGDKATNVGTYTATVSLKDPVNNAWSDGTTADKTISWTIASKVVNVPEVTTAETYTGSIITLGLASNADYTVTGNTALNAGSYTATLSLNDKTNDAWSDGTTADKTVAWTVAKAKVSVPEVTETEFTYDGQEKELGIAANALYTVTGDKATDAGDYTANVRLNDTTNYEWSKTFGGRISWYIDKADYTLPDNVKFEDASYDYDGSEHSVTVAGLDNSIQVTYTNNTLTYAGEVNATATFTVSDNYNETTLNAKLTVAKAANEFVGYEDKELTYNGAAQDLGISAKFGDVALTICTDKDDAEATAVTEIKNAGTYYVKAAVAGTASYDGLDGEWKTVTVKKADIDISGYEVTDTFEFDGTEKQVAVTGLPEGVTYSVTGTALTEPGTSEVTIVFAVTDADNYNAPEAVAETLKVTNKVISISTYEELDEALHNQRNFGAGANYYEYHLANDIDCQDKGTWTPVGTTDTPFSAIFDGEGYSIKNMQVGTAATDNLQVRAAMFSMCGTKVVIQNLVIDNMTVTATNTEDHSYGFFASCLVARFSDGDNTTSTVKNITIKNSTLNADNQLANTCHIGILNAYDRLIDGCVRDNITILNSTINYVGATNKKVQIGALCGDTNYQGNPNYGKYSNVFIDDKTTVNVTCKTQLKQAWVGGFVGHAGTTANTLIMEKCISFANINIYGVSESTADMSSCLSGTYAHWFGTGDSSANAGEGNATYTFTDSVWAGTYNVYDIVVTVSGESTGTVGGTIQLTAAVTPDKALINKTCAWTSSDETIATVDADGKVTLLAAGTVKITATADGISSSEFEITVSAAE